MRENDYTPETVREFVIDYYVDQTLFEQAAKEHDIIVEDSEVNEQVDSMKKNYDSDDAWNEALETAGITEDQYRDSIKQGLLQSKLQEEMTKDVQAADEEVLETYNMYSSMFDNSKRSSHILFNADEEAKANDVLAQINAGTISFEDAAKENSHDEGSAQNGGDVGWNTLTTFVTEYEEGLSTLGKGQVSQPIKSDYGYHIIKVTDEFSPTENTTDLNAIPSEFVEYIRTIVKSQNQSTKFQEWFETYKEEAEVTIEPMPENVPYNIDPSFYEPQEGSEGDDAATEGADEDGVITLTEEDLYGEEGAEGTDGDQSAEGDAASGEGSAEQPSEQPAEEGE